MTPTEKLKLTAGLISLLDTVDGPNATGAERIFLRDRTERPHLHLFVELSNSTPPEIPKVRFLSGRDRVRTALVAREQLSALLSHESVIRVSEPSKLFPLVDLAREFIRLPVFAALEKLDGRSVIVGIVDTGIDADHDALNGRILSIWDQTLPHTGSAEVEYGQLLGPGSFGASDDTWGHGTHVGGIIASQHESYRGIAPGADLIIVKSGFDSATVAEAVQFIFDQADKLDRPAVINLSMGGHADSHDGTDPLSMLLDQLVGPGRIIVAAAGNEGAEGIHAQELLQPGASCTLPVIIKPETVLKEPLKIPLTLNGWCDGQSNIQFWLEPPRASGSSRPRSKTYVAGATSSPPTDTEKEVLGQNKVHFTVRTAAYTANQDHHFQVEIFGDVTDPQHPFANGTWDLHIQNTGDQKVTVHIWLIRPSEFQNKDMHFAPEAARRACLIGSPGSCSSVLTVGACITRTSWKDQYNRETKMNYKEGDVPAFSSPGPLRNGREKPDFVAPGGFIISCLSNKAAADRSQIVESGWVVLAGTSMAAPVVSGIVALLLQRDRTLGPDQVREMLRKNCFGTEAPGSYDPRFGYGWISVSDL
jgi:subtilisin family serine protease